MTNPEAQQSSLSHVRAIWVASKGIPPLDFSLLVQHVTHKSKLELLTTPNCVLSTHEYTELHTLLERRYHGEPLAYLTLHKEFFGREFFVTKDTLIPRPESECLIEDILSAYEGATHKPVTCLDIGTGSGALIISLALSLPPTLHYFGSDVSSVALKVAKTNQERLGSSVTFLAGSFLTPYDDTLFTQGPLFIVANLPYVSEKLFSETPKSVQDYEPALALLSSREGLAHYQKLLQEISQRRGHTPFTAWLEISPEQTETLLALIQKIFPSAVTFVGQDLSSRERFIRIKVI